MRARLATILAIVHLVGLASCTPEQPRVTLSSRYEKQSGQPSLIIFVHGVGGDPAGTWVNPKSGASWPTLISTDPDFASYDVMSAYYDSPKISQASTIEEISTRLDQQFEDLGVYKYQSIIFLAHSMGGLVAKRIVAGLNRPAADDRLKRVTGVLLISTPSQGAPLADIADWVSMNPQFRDMSPADFNTYLQSVENQWQQLLIDRDHRRLTHPRAFCAYETRATAGRTIVVSRVYAATRCDRNPYPMDLDHFAIVKPHDRNDDPYRWAKSRILESMSAALIPQAATGHSQGIEGRGQLFVTSPIVEWRPSGLAESTRSTGDHHCERNCQGEPTRTNYRLELRSDPGFRLVQPELSCLGGACPWSQVHGISSQEDGRLIIASFDVWSRPTTWRLRAGREQANETLRETRGSLSQFKSGDILEWRVPKGFRSAAFRGETLDRRGFALQLGVEADPQSAQIFVGRGSEEVAGEVVYRYAVR